MMWIDIGVTVLLILRVVLSRPALPPRVDSTIEELLPYVRAEQQDSLFVVMGQ